MHRLPIPAKVIIECELDAETTYKACRVAVSQGKTFEEWLTEKLREETRDVVITEEDIAEIQKALQPGRELLN